MAAIEVDFLVSPPHSIEPCSLSALAPASGSPLAFRSNTSLALSSRSFCLACIASNSRCRLAATACSLSSCWRRKVSGSALLAADLARACFALVALEMRKLAKVEKLDLIDVDRYNRPCLFFYK